MDASVQLETSGQGQGVRNICFGQILAKFLCQTLHIPEAAIDKSAFGESCESQ